MASFEYEKLLNTVTFTAAANSPGDVDGTGNPTSLFTVTGDIVGRICAIPSLNLFQNDGHFWIGHEDNVLPLLDLLTKPPTPVESDELSIIPSEFTSEEYVISNTTIHQIVSGADVVEGSMKYYIVYAGLSTGATVELA